VRTCFKFPAIVIVKAEVFLVVMKLEKLRKKAIIPLINKAETTEELP